MASISDNSSGHRQAADDRVGDRRRVRPRTPGLHERAEAVRDRLALAYQHRPLDDVLETRPRGSQAFLEVRQRLASLTGQVRRYDIAGGVDAVLASDVEHVGAR